MGTEFPCKLFRFTVGFSHLEKSPFVQASAHIASANAKKSKLQIFGPSTRRAKNQNFWNLTNYIPLDPEFYADHYSQKDCTLKSNFNKDMTRIRLSSGKFLQSIISIITLCRSSFKTIMIIFFLHVCLFYFYLSTLWYWMQ